MVYISWTWKRSNKKFVNKKFPEMLTTTPTTHHQINHRGKLLVRQVLEMDSRNTAACEKVAWIPWTYFTLFFQNYRGSLYLNKSYRLTNPRDNLSDWRGQSELGSQVLLLKDLPIKHWTVNSTTAEKAWKGICDAGTPTLYNAHSSWTQKDHHCCGQI